MQNAVSSDDRKPDNAQRDAADAAHAPENADRTASGSVGCDGRADVVTICAWCPELHVLKIDRQLGDLIMLAVNGTGRLESAYRKRQGEPVTLLTISDGICDACRAKWFAEG